MFIVNLHVVITCYITAPIKDENSDDMVQPLMDDDVDDDVGANSGVAEGPDATKQTPMNTVQTVEITPAVTTTTNITVIDPKPGTQDTSDSSNVPILAWRSNSKLEDGSARTEVSQDKAIVRADTHAEVVSRRRRINCAVS